MKFNEIANRIRNALGIRSKRRKVFRYPKGHISYVTLTVGSLVNKLAAFPPDMPVLATWEGQHVPFREDDCWYEVQRIDYMHSDDTQDCLVVSVENY